MGDQQVVAFSSYRSLEDHDHFCAMLGCYLARAPDGFHCCPGHLQLATQESQRPFRFYGGFSDDRERDECCTSIVVLRSNQIPTGVPDLNHMGNIFTTLPWFSGETFPLRNTHDRCSFLFFKEQPLSYGEILKDAHNEIAWRGNENRKVDMFKGAPLTRKSISLRFVGTSLKWLEDISPGKWSLMNYFYRGHSLYCMSYERKGGSDKEKEEDSNDDRKKDGDKEKEKDSDDDGDGEKKYDDKHPGVSLTKKARTLYPSPRAEYMKLLASGADDGEIRLVKPSHFPLLTGIGSAKISWNRRVQQQVSASTSYDGTTGVIAMEWCPSDNSYLLTCAKDNRTIFWDINTVEDYMEKTLVLALATGNERFSTSLFEKLLASQGLLKTAMKAGGLSPELCILEAASSKTQPRSTMPYNQTAAGNGQPQSTLPYNQFAQGEEGMILCDAPASKLMAAGNTLAAVLCYICAGNVELLQDLMEKTLVLALATGNERFSTSLFDSYAELLASQGLLKTAMKAELCILETNTAASSNTQPRSTMPYNQTASGNV